MPALGAGMDVGRIIEWHVKAGDQVHRGDIVALVETDKANIDVEVFEDGVIEEILVEEGTKVPVGTPLARIGSGTAAVPAATAEAGAPAAGEPGAVVGAEAGSAAASAAGEPGAVVGAEEPQLGSAPASATPAVEAEAPGVAASGDVTGEGEEHPFVTSPLVRRQAQEVGVDLAHVDGTGPGGAITRHDVDLAAAAVSGDGSSAPRAAPEAEAPGHRSSPYARQLAATNGLDPGELVGTGPGGVVIARDVLAAAAPPADPRGAVAAGSRSVGEGAAATAGAPAAGDRGSRVTPQGDAGADKAAAKAQKEARALAMRQAIARAMERANREIPHYYLGETIDAEDTLRWLADLNAQRPPADRILPAALVLKATALALREYPDFNGYWIDDAFQAGDGIHLGVAINLRRGGLLAPAIRDADQRTLDELMEALKDLVQRTRAGGLKGSELTDPTITVSNLGDTGVETIQGVITPPQVALVGVGRITERPWAVDGMLAVRRTIYLSLAGDHRASDGHRGGRFLAAIAANLGRPETLT
jgi:pyruvate dehydrogenase E2 component (dihydrolipoamide acetyltransferase)